MDIKLKSYSGKFLKNKSLMFNTLLILSMFMISQLIGVYICFKFFSGNLIFTLLSLTLINFIFYKKVLS